MTKLSDSITEILANYDVTALLRDYSLEEVLVALRIKWGLTQADIASAMGKSQSYIAKFESRSLAKSKVGDILEYGRLVGLKIWLEARENERSES